MRPNENTLRAGAPPIDFVERPWGAPSLFPGGAIFVLGMLVFGAIILTLHPNVLLWVRVQCGMSPQTSVKVLKVLAVCSVYMAVGPLLIILNKEILQTLSFDLPLFLSCLGLLTTGMVIRSCVALGMCEVRPETREVVEGNSWCMTVLPIAIAKAITLASGNAVYLYLGLGFIQMLKAFTPVIVCVVLGLFGMPTPTRLGRWGVYLIVSGTLVEVKGELNLTILGLVLMLTSEVCEAINLVLTQKLLHNCKFTLVEGLYFIAPPSGLVLCAAAVVLEGPKLWSDGKYKTLVQYPGYFVASCVLGLAVNFIGLAVMQLTSSLTVKVLNTIRGIGVILVGFLFYGEHCSGLELCGYAVALSGFCLYNWAQYSSEQKVQQAESAK